ncbi:tetratricopeptide repeat protein [Stieleria sp. JC731]|uniref:tetratricopeptide repeat protein n=1 Tax=Stieleria sp. JC731 TaxID=2894195 RepID=UPI001E3FD675|nr:tetratricopeptide repeat protein [Stieleria sp. JC731]MCC9603556.1 tetratricopeptide repeat protein [Stieleria sp. JC731]
MRLVWSPPPPTDPYVGFSESVPLIVPSSIPSEVEFNSAKLVWFNQQRFSRDKPADVFRIVCLGGSTTYGRPFDDGTSFCGWLRKLLPAVEPKTKWEVINAGAISYASYRVAAVMEQFVPYDIDLFIVYTGQNEFLEWRTYDEQRQQSPWIPRLSSAVDKTYVGKLTRQLVTQIVEPPASDSAQLSGDVDEMLNHSVGPSSYVRDDLWHEGVLAHLEFNLGRMKLIAEQAGARLAIINPASNLRDCEPFKSLGTFAEQIAPQQSPTAEAASQVSNRKQDLNNAIETARDLISIGAIEDATAMLQSVVGDQPRHAGANYLLGKAMFDKKQFSTAELSFQTAVDEDVCPLRAPTKVREAIRRFSSQPGIIQVDFESLLARQSMSELGHQCFGAEYFLDHVHPTIDCHGELARMIVNELATEGIVTNQPTDGVFQEVSDVIHGSIDRVRQGVAFRNLAKVTHWAGKFSEAKRHATDALRLIPGDGESQYLMADCCVKLGQLTEGLQQYEVLFQSGGFDRAALPYGELLAREGQLQAAKTYLLQAVFVSQGPRQRTALMSLGQVHSQLGEDELAAECFAEAAKIR